MVDFTNFLWKFDHNNINVIFIPLIAELQEKGNRIQLKVGPEVQPKEFMISAKKKLIHPFEREINRKARKIRISLEKWSNFCWCEIVILNLMIFFVKPNTEKIVLIVLRFHRKKLYPQKILFRNEKMYHLKMLIQNRKFCFKLNERIINKKILLKNRILLNL